MDNRASTGPETGGIRGLKMIFDNPQAWCINAQGDRANLSIKRRIRENGRREFEALDYGGLGSTNRPPFQRCYLVLSQPGGLWPVSSAIVSGGLTIARRRVSRWTTPPAPLPYLMTIVCPTTF